MQFAKALGERRAFKVMKKKKGTGFGLSREASKGPGSDGSLSSLHCGPHTFHFKHLKSRGLFSRGTL